LSLASARGVCRLSFLSPVMSAAGDFDVEECKSRVYLKGLSTFGIVFAGCYFVQRAVSRGQLAPVVLFGSSAAFGLMSGYLRVNALLVECDKTAKQRRDNWQRTAGVTSKH